MAKVRKMLGKADSPYIVSLMRLIETQSKNTIVKWCNEYAREYILPIYEKDYPEDSRLKNALNASNEWLEGKMKLTEAKKIIKEAQIAAREYRNMEEALRKVAIIDEPNPAKINWNC